MVFDFLQRKYTEINYYKTSNNREIDFLIDAQESKILIQATCSLEKSDTRDREIKSLIKAMDELKLHVGYNYTWNGQE